MYTSPAFLYRQIYHVVEAYPQCICFQDSSLIPISGLGILLHNKLIQLESCVDVLLSRVRTYVQNMPSERVPQILIPTV